MATYTTRDGCTLHYEIVGDGPSIALTPGGRSEKEALKPLVAELSKHARVLTWDRRNCGHSDVFFGGTGSEQEIWADDFAEMLRAIGFAPAFIGGGSAGCRCALITALRHPDVCKGLVLWSASGGPYGCQWLGFQYHVPFILAAQKGGMEDVAKTLHFAERIAANPGNRARLLAQQPDAFIATMRRWNEFFYFQPDTPVVGATKDQLKTIAVPTLVFEGNDDIHPANVAQAIAALIPKATLVPSPWSGEEFTNSFAGRSTTSVFQLYPRLVPQIAKFLGAA